MAMQPHKPRIGVVLLACLLAVSTAGSARAAIYHVLDLGQAAEGAYASLAPEDGVRGEQGGDKALTIDKVTVDFANGGKATLDEMQVRFDCSAKRFKVLSERVHQGLDTGAPSADKTNADDWRTFSPGSPMDGFQALACSGPSSIKQEVAAFDRPSVWDAASTVAGALAKIHQDQTGGAAASK